MRSGVLPGSVAVAVVVAIASVGCTDDGSNPGGSNMPGMNEVDDEGYRDTSVPALSDPQFTAAPNPNAGRGGAPAPGDPDPADVTPTIDP